MLGTEELLEGVVSYLKDNLSNFKRPDRSIRVMVNERSIPSSGEEFIGVNAYTIANLNPPNAGTKRVENGVKISYTVRVNGVPNDVIGEALWTHKAVLRVKPSIVKRCNQIIDLLDENWTLMSSVNALTVAAYGGCYLKALGFVSMDAEPQLKDEDHFDIETEFEQAPNLRPVGLLTEIELGGAEYFVTRS